MHTGGGGGGGGSGSKSIGRCMSWLKSIPVPIRSCCTKLKVLSDGTPIIVFVQKMLSLHV